VTELVASYIRRPGSVIIATITCKEDIDTQVRVTECRCTWWAGGGAVRPRLHAAAMLALDNGFSLCSTSQSQTHTWHQMTQYEALASHTLHQTLHVAMVPGSRGSSVERLLVHD
jgi:hypothetical protein